MEGINIFYASQSSTAICLSMDQPSSSYSSSISNTAEFGGRAIEHHNLIITDPRRTPSRDLISPSSFSQSPIEPKPLHDHLQKTKKNFECFETWLRAYSFKKKKNISLLKT